jgi:hypothetical protein
MTLGHLAIVSQLGFVNASPSFQSWSSSSAKPRAFLLSADGEGKLRVSWHPAHYIVERFCLARRSFLTTFASLSDAAHADGRQFTVTGGLGPVLDVWDHERGALVSQLSLSSDASATAAGSDASTAAADTQSWKQMTMSAPHSFVCCLAAHGSTLAAAFQPSSDIFILTLSNGALQQTQRIPPHQTAPAATATEATTASAAATTGGAGTPSSLHFDRTGRLWISGAASGVHAYELDTASGLFVPFSHPAVPALLTCVASAPIAACSALSGELFFRHIEHVEKNRTVAQKQAQRQKEHSKAKEAQKRKREQEKEQKRKASSRTDKDNRETASAASADASTGAAGAAQTDAMVTESTAKA